MITLLTDFGWTDPWVGEMKGVMLGIDPGIPLVDLTHGVAPGAVREAAWILARSWRTFPPGTHHLVVVDPGVGTARRGLAVRAGEHWFVGPDNGVLLPAAEAAGEALELREITVRELDHPRRGTTFDGRDLFAPTAARMHAGIPFLEIGPEVADPVRVPGFAPRPADDGWELEVVRADRFGNLATVADEAFLRERFGEEWRDVTVMAGERSLRGITSGYGDVPEGEPLLSIGGTGVLEISVNRGSARHVLDVRPGDVVRLRGPADGPGRGTE